MKSHCMILIVIVVGLPLTVCAQSLSFEMLARNDDYGSVHALAELPDGNICLASTRGLHVYARSDSGFVSLYKQDSDIIPHHLAVLSDGTVFTACRSEGLYAYHWDGSAMRQIAQSGVVADVFDVVASEEGTVFVAGGYSGCVILQWDGTRFTAVDSLSRDGHLSSIVLMENGDIIGSFGSNDDSLHAIRFGDQRLVHLSSLFVGAGVGSKHVFASVDKSRLFVAMQNTTSIVHYDDSGFTSLGTIGTDYVRGVAGTDSLVFVGEGSSLSVHRRVGGAYTLLSRCETDFVGPVDILLASDGMIYTAEWNDGLGAFILKEDSLSETGRVNEGGYVYDVGQDPSGLIWVANGAGGVRVYRRVDSTLVSLAHIDEGGHAADIALTRDGTAIVANAKDGLRAYTLQDGRLQNVGHLPDSGWYDLVEIGPDGTIFAFNTRRGLTAIQHDGSKFSLLASSRSLAWAEDLTIAEDGTVILGNGNMGLEAYDFTGDSLLLRARERLTVFGVAATPDSTIFAALWWRGLQAYRYDGQQFSLLAWDEDIPALAVRVDQNGTVFVTIEDTVQAYHFDGDSFILLGNYPQPCWNIYLGDSSTVFALNEQLIMLRYNATAAGIHPPVETDVALENYPNPFQPTTTIQYELQRPATVSLSVFNMYGKRVQQLFKNQHRAEGLHTETFDGHGLAPGVYYYCLEYAGYKHLRKMLLLR